MPRGRVFSAFIHPAFVVSDNQIRVSRTEDVISPGSAGYYLAPPTPLARRPDEESYLPT